jgi:ABC-2 type transport system ATP-binding protein
MNAVTFNNVSKHYGARVALDAMTFHIPRGSIAGLVGPNGSGKTTTMGLLGGLLRHQRGQIDLLGDGPFSAVKHGGRVSLLPQDCVPSPHLSIREVMRFYAELQGMRRADTADEVDHRLEQVQLRDRASSKYSELSHGMRRRFGIAQALLGSPELLMLDEPTSGLDPELVVQIRELLASMRGQCTLIVSSHVLGELESLCDYVVFIDRGRCVRQGSLKEVTKEENIVRYTLGGEPDLDALRISLQACTLSWQAPVLTVKAPASQSVEETNRHCLQALLEADTGILEVRTGHSLEETYLQTRQSVGS